jgi:hypothetical protein
MALSKLPKPRKRKRRPQDEGINEWRDAILKLIWDIADDFWEWTPARLADEAGLAPTTIYNLRAGITVDCRSSTLGKLARATGVSLGLKLEDLKMVEWQDNRTRTRRQRKQKLRVVA